MNKFFLYNTLSRQKEVFKPKFENDVRMYVCGPTVYDHPHVGNARPLIVFDLLFRILQKLYKSENVTYVRNITDIDDKIIETSQKQNIEIGQLTKIVTKYFHDDCLYLGCLNPNVEPKATEHISEMIKLTKKLIELNANFNKPVIGTGEEFLSQKRFNNKSFVYSDKIKFKR